MKPAASHKSGWPTVYPLIKIKCEECKGERKPHPTSPDCPTCHGSGTREVMVGKLDGKVEYFPEFDEWEFNGLGYHTEDLLDDEAPFVEGHTFDTTEGPRVAGEVGLVQAGALGAELRGDLLDEWKFRKLVMVDWEGTAHTWLCRATAEKGEE